MQGKTINGFELKRPLGVGGMAEVWYAENEIGKPAAVKILNKDLSYNDQIVERFKNEAMIMVKLDHPNIRQVYGYGKIDGRHTIVQEYLDGDDLKALMKSGRKFTEAELEKWWNQMVDALNYTHIQGIVHRDIKPSNIFIDRRGNVRLLDFGIAKIKESISMTQTGAMMGTLMYMSPEQVCDSKHIDYRTDIYSLAVTFVHLLTGKAPYDTGSSNDFTIRKGIVEQQLDMTGVPTNWRSFLMPYLAKDPQQRPALMPFGSSSAQMTSSSNSASQFGTGVNTNTTDGDDETVVDSPREQKPVSTTTAQPKKNRKGLWIGLGVGAAVLIAILVIVFSTKDSNCINGHEYVDLGLPSGTLWATCNVGAESPEEFGNYYAKGEISVKDTYASSNYRPQDKDVATNDWGEKWRIPTCYNYEELIAECQWKWSAMYSPKLGFEISGYKVTGPNGNSIFLPAAYYETADDETGEFEEWGYYRASTQDGPEDGCGLCFNEFEIKIGVFYTQGLLFDYEGAPVRPVCIPSKK